MTYHYVRLFLIWILLISCAQLHAQRFEAEAGTLTNGAKLAQNEQVSGGKYVRMEGGNLALTIGIEAEGFYTIAICAAAPYGYKTNTFKIDNYSVDFSYAQNSLFIKKQLASNLKLTKGQHTLEVIKSWGWIDIDYFEFTCTLATYSQHIDQTLVTPDPIPQARRLYQFLLDHYGKNIISGVMTLNSMDEVNWLKTQTGKEPALVGIDFMHCGRNYSWYNDNTPMNDARNYYNRHGIPAMCWHWRDPSRNTEEFYTSKTTFDVSKINDSTSAEYQAMIKDIDYIAGFFLKLQRDSVAVIWRPLHEAAGGWFWWGAKGAAPCKKLYQTMWNRMVNYHGIQNLIWVWTREPNDEAWYPGDEYVDIIGRDIYKQGDHGSQLSEYIAMNTLYKGNKLLSISECGSFPDPDNLLNEGAAWSYFMPWYGDFVKSPTHNPITLWKKAFDHPYVLTLDEMPDLRTYDQEVSASTYEIPQIKVYPTLIDQEVTIRSDRPIGRIAVFNSTGQKILSRSFDQNEVSLPVDTLKKGIYFLKIEGLDSIKLIKP